MGGGLKLEYTHKMVDVSVDFFKAKDDVNSITQEMQLPNDTSTIDQIKPQDNATGSLMLNLRLTDKLSFKAEYGLSAMNYDISKEDSTASSFSNSIVQQSGDLALYYAFKTSLTQSTSIGTWGATYERVDPNYKTLGAYYFNNDLENLTANLSTTIFKTLNIGVDLGYQRDNLESQKMNGSFTTLYNVNASAQLTPKLNLGASFSNNQTHVYIKSIYDELEQTNEFQNLDTLNFTQINLNTGATVSYILKSSEMQKQHLNFAFSYQQAAESQEQDQRFMGTEIYNTTGSYLFSLIEQKLNISTTVNNNYTKMEETNLSVMSYNVSIQKTLAEKVRLSLISTYSSSLSGGEKMADIVNVRFSSSYTLAQKHNFNLSVASVSNITASGNRKQLSGTLAYSYLFDFRLLKKDKKMKFEGNF